MARRETRLGRLFTFFHTHPQGRLYEILFFTVLGILFAGSAWFFYARGSLAEPLFYVLVFVGACFVGFAFLPQKKPKHKAAVPKGKRGVIAQQVQASKSEKKRRPVRK